MHRFDMVDGYPVVVCKNAKVVDFGGKQLNMGDDG